jgi:hypothetical protein
VDNFHKAILGFRGCWHYDPSNGTSGGEIKVCPGTEPTAITRSLKRKCGWLLYMHNFPIRKSDNPQKETEAT